MADSAAHLVDEVLPQRPILQRVLSVPFPMRLLFATYPDVMSKVLDMCFSNLWTLWQGWHRWYPSQEST